MNKFEDTYWGKEIAEILQVGDSTLRKWCLSLENKGYIFLRGQHNSRAFVERDLLILRRMKDMIQNKGITLETASDIVISRFKENERTSSVLEENREEEQNLPAAISVPQNDLLLEVLERQERLEEQNNQLLLMLQEQKNHIQNSLEKRDIQLIQALKETQETKKLVASTIEKKNIFQRIFGK